MPNSIEQPATTAVLPDISPGDNGHHGHGVAVYNGRIYLSGGTDSTGARSPYIHSATPDLEDGNFATFNPDPITLGESLFAHETLALNGQLFVLGGIRGSELDPSGYVGAALLETDGYISSNWVESPLLSPARFWHAAVVSVDSWIYVIGGSETGDPPS